VAANQAPRGSRRRPPGRGTARDRQRPAEGGVPVRHRQWHQTDWTTFLSTAVAGDDDTAVGDRVDALGRQDEPFDVELDPAVLEQLGVAVGDRPRVARTGYAGQDQPGRGQPDEPESTILMTGGGRHRARPEDERCDQPKGCAIRSDRTMANLQRTPNTRPVDTSIDTSGVAGWFPAMMGSIATRQSQEDERR
jgi:hypothetical protein